MNQMQYSPDIVERVESLSHKALEKRRILQDFMGILQDRVNLEDYYSRNLEKIGESLSRLIHGRDQMKEIFLLFRNYVAIQAEQSRSLARSIKNEVANEIQVLLKNETPWQKEVSALSKRHQKEVRTYIERLNHIRNEYVFSIEDEVRSQQSGDYKPRFSKSRPQCENQLRSYIDVYNRYIDEYFSDIAAVQDTFTTLEVSRRKCVQDSTMKLLMYEVSYVRNLQYDLNGITAKLEAYNPRKDLSELFQEQQSEKPLLCKLNFVNYQNFLHQQLKYTPPNRATEPVLERQQSSETKPVIERQQSFEPKKRRPIFEGVENYARNETTAPPATDGSNPLLMKMFQTALFNNIVSDQAIQQLEERIKGDPTLLSSFAVSLERIMALSVNQGEKPILVDPNGYISMSRIIFTFLDAATPVNLNDLVRIMKLGQLIYKRVNKPDDEGITEEYLLSKGLQSHALFSDMPRLLSWGVSLVQQDVLESITSFTQALTEVGCPLANDIFNRLMVHFNLEDRSLPPVLSTSEASEEMFS